MNAARGINSYISFYLPDLKFGGKKIQCQRVDHKVFALGY